MEKVEDTPKEYQGWNEWADKFKPIKNKFTIYSDDTMFETYGEELDFVKAQDPRCVWTYVDGDMSSVLLAGFHFVNRLGYYVTEVPWDNEWDSCLLAVEAECACYNEDEDVMETRDMEYGDPDCKECEGSGYATNYV